MPQSTVQTLVLFFYTAAGFAAGKLRYLDEGVGRGLSKFLVNFILPALIIVSMQRPFSAQLRTEAFTVLAISFGVYALSFPLAYLLVKLEGARGGEAGAHAFAAVFSNVAFMGFPVMEALYGRDSLFAVSVYNIPFQLLAFSVGPYMLARSAGKQARLGVASFITPAAAAAVLGMLLFMLGLSLPAPIFESLNTLGNCTTPLSMALIGSIISRIELRKIAGNWRLYVTTLYRLVLFPLLLFAILRALGVSGTLLSLPVVIGAMPVAVNSAILAEAYGGDSE
ncbi:MAG TPA: AEC family transporter, partial [Rectinemataceae bacterium]|nr:AEC family transporter [Rectinemataceae bacterium]